MMKQTISLLGLLFILVISANAQAFLKYEHFGKSSFRDENNDKLKDYKGSANVYRGGVNIPLSMKMNENNKPTMWSVGVGGAYASLSNYNFAEIDKPLDEILNMQLAITHLRPIKEKMSLLVSVGGGVFMGDTRLSKIRGKHLLASGAGVLIWHLKPNLDLGAGLALNNTFGYPMVFPALYLNWRLDGKYKVSVSMIDGLNLSAGYSPSEKLDLNLVMEMTGQMALLEIEGKDMVFSHQYIVMGIQPKLKLNKHFSIPLTAGVHFQRAAYYKKRTLKAMFSNEGDHDPYFQISPYVSAGINYAF